VALLSLQSIRTFAGWKPAERPAGSRRSKTCVAVIAAFPIANSSGGWTAAVPGGRSAGFQPAKGAMAATRANRPTD